MRYWFRIGCYRECRQGNNYLYFNMSHKQSETSVNKVSKMSD